MKRIDKVAELLRQYSEKTPVTASEIAEQLNITRANVSSDLNQLVKLGKAEKNGTKPVFFFSTNPKEETETNILDDFIKKSPSLFHCGEQAKAAVLYPPNGMHILLTGETGVGKSMFAELIYTYAVSQNKVKADSNFVTFNCADYANNPQLLVGSIFGVLKGAYTGADSDRTGLLEKANGGILFLDEIHRLPPEGQEMLFTFIDRGVYRRLGETSSERQAQVLLVCATTEDTSSSLLQTFIRRIPMRIEIPSLIERGLEERLGLIATFFQMETKKLGTAIEVSTNTIRALLGYHCPNNVGQLKADIQLLCAKAYAQFIARQEETIKIGSYELPHYIREGLYNNEDRKKIWLLLPNMNARFFLFNEEETTLFLPKDTTNGNDIYQIIEQKMNDMERIGLDFSQTSEIIDTTITNYYRSYDNDSTIDLTNLEQIVGSEIVATANKVCEKASRLLNVYLPDNVRYGLSLHLYNTIQRIKRGQTIINPRISEIKKEYPRHFETAQHCLSVIETDFSIQLPEDEVAFLALFFTTDENKSKKRAKVEVIVVAHGESTATSMATVVNKLLGEQIAVGFDMSLDEKPITALTNIQNYLSSKEQLKDVLLLVDMGSLINFSDELEKKLNIQIRCIELVSTLHVLEASRKASLGYGLNEIFEATINIRGLSTYKKHSEEKSPSKLYILTLCTTGEGSAQMIKKMLSSRLNLRGAACEIVSLQITDQKLLEQTVANLSQSGKIICTIGTFQYPFTAPHFSITDALDETKTEKIQSLIDYEIAFEGMRLNIATMLEYKDGENLILSIREWVETMAAEINPAISYEIKIGLSCHIVCMIDRLKQGKNVSTFPQTLTFKEKYSNEISIVQKNSQFLEAYYAISIPKDEIFYITAFFMSESFI